MMVDQEDRGEAFPYSKSTGRCPRDTSRRFLPLWTNIAFTVFCFLLFVLIPDSQAGGKDSQSIIELEPYEVVSHPTGAFERNASVWVLEPSGDGPVPSSIRDTLSLVPGLHIDQRGGPGGRSSLYLRGLEDNHALVMADGISLNNPTGIHGGAVNFSLIEPSLFEEIAVVRGAPSVRYGPEALSGAIHLGSYPDAAPGTSLNFSVGGDKFNRASLESGRSVAEDVFVSLRGGRASDGRSDDGGHYRREFIRGAAMFEGATRLRLSVLHMRSDTASFPEQSGGFEQAVRRNLESSVNRTSGLSIVLDSRIGDNRFEISANAAEFKSTVASPGIAPGLANPFGIPASKGESRFRRMQGQCLIEIPLGESVFTIGADVQHEKGKDNSFLLGLGPKPVPASYDDTRSRVGAFGEAVYNVLDDTALSLGARVDHYDGGEERGTVRAGILRQITPGMEWRFNVGNTFKLPSFYALSNPLVGDPNLKPEKALSADTGLRKLFLDGRGILDLSVFSSRSKDGIDYDPQANRMVNVEKIRTRGVEAAFQVRDWGRIDLSGSLTYAHTRGEPGGRRLLSRPTWYGAVAADWKVTEVLRLQASLNYTGRILDSSIPTGEKSLGSWLRTDIGALWEITDNVDLSIYVDNLFDREYQESIGFPAQGRRIRVGISVEL